ncbi:MAG: DNA-3-methyladenine glycosylase [Pirellulaceae bacterium]|nr:DNA-3-methyladenine glycosylase [Pirellulaceae bacterium]
MSERFPMDPLPVAFYDRDVVRVARELLGTLLCRTTRHGLAAGRIVETEAYLAADDTACHAARGKNRKNASMFGPPGRAYVYPIHARWCFNVVTEPRRVASAVLIRAIEPLAGIPLMQQRRGLDQRTDLARGPARLCEALAIDRRLDGWNLSRGRRVWIAADQDGPFPDERIGCSPRIGVTSAAELHLRFYVRGNPYVSGPQRLRV